MTSKLTPKDPEKVMVTRQVTPNITIFSAPFWRFGHIKVGGRGTVVRLQNGSLAVFSPVALTPAVKQTVASLGGDVRYIAALDIEHHIFLGQWHEAFPNAKVIGPEGLPEKRKKQKNEDVPFAAVFTAKNKASLKIDPAFDAEFEYEYLDGHGNKELVFFHKPDKVLIEADLIFNLPATEQFSKTGESASTGAATKFFTSLNNTQGNAIGQKRFILYAISSGNRTSFNKSTLKIDAWDFDKIIPCHGDVIEKNGKGVFRTVMEWHLAAAKGSK